MNEKNFFVQAFTCLIALLILQPANADGRDPLTRMFEWWNKAIATPGALTESAFQEYFTDDIVLILNGKVSSDGISELTKNFQHIQANSETVRIVLPFVESFSQGDRIFTHHFIYSVRNGEEHCLRAMGYAVIRNEKIARIHFLRVPYEPGISIDNGCKDEVKEIPTE